MLNLDTIGRRAYDTAVKSGFRGDGAAPENIERDLLLVHSELSEATECLREDASIYEIETVNNKPVGFAVEMADALIRITEICTYWGVPLEAAVKIKMEYNETRPHRHGGKKY